MYVSWAIWNLCLWSTLMPGPSGWMVLGDDVWDCNRPWPDMELFLPLAISGSDRRHEWRQVFLRTFLLFWPVEIAKTKLLLLIDEEKRNSTGTQEVENYLATIPRMKGLYRLGYNQLEPIYYSGIGAIRQQYLMFYADNFTSAEFVGFCDTDSFFLTYVDREDLFENGKPVVNGKSGNPAKKYNKDPLWHDIMQTTFDVLGVKEPMKCMAYFPVIVKTIHMRKLREYLEKKYNMPFYDVFRLHISSRRFSQFNVFCAYLFHFHQDEYTWYAHDVSPEWDYSNALPGQVNNASVYTSQMRMPKPRIATHARYHSPNALTGGYDLTTADVLQSGICFSPPFPKPVEWAPCRFYSRMEDYENEIFEEMHRFEWSDFTQVQHPNSLKHQAHSRFLRIKDCAKDWSMDAVHENVTQIMDVRLQLSEGGIIYTHETGKRMFMVSNHTLRGFPNWDTFVTLGCVGKPTSLLSHRQFRNFEHGPDLEPRDGKVEPGDPRCV